MRTRLTVTLLTLALLLSACSTNNADDTNGASDGPAAPTAAAGPEPTGSPQDEKLSGLPFIPAPTEQPQQGGNTGTANGTDGRGGANPTPAVSVPPVSPIPPEFKRVSQDIAAAIRDLIQIASSPKNRPDNPDIQTYRQKDFDFLKNPPAKFEFLKEFKVTVSDDEVVLVYRIGGKAGAECRTVLPNKLSITPGAVVPSTLVILEYMTCRAI